jgi:hypothetical protein
VFHRYGYCNPRPDDPSMRKGTFDDPNSSRFTYYMYSYTFASWGWIHNLFYDATGVKRILPELEPYINARSLAVWIMGDGSFQRGGVVLCTDSFTVDDVELLCAMLRNRLGLVVDLVTSTKGYPRIRIYKKSMPVLHKLVLPHMDVSMHYKLGIGQAPR